MNSLFDAAFDAMAAWNQAGLLIGGMVMLLIGGTMIAWFVYVRMTHIRVKGRIVAVRATGIGGEAQDNGSSSEGEPEPSPDAAEAFKKSPGAGLAGGLVALLFVAIPLLFVGIGAYFAYDYLGLYLNGIETQAVVINNIYESDSDSSTYRALVSFEDRSGRTWEVKDNIGKGGSPIYRVGEDVTVRYEPGDPEHMIVGGFWKNMILPLVFTGIGSLFLFLMFGGMLVKREGGQPRGKRAGFSGEMYYPVYEYRAHDGTAIRGEGNTGSNWLGNKVPGTPVRLFVRRGEPDSISRPGVLMLVFGLCFAAPGLFMTYTGLTQFEFNIFTILFGLGFLAFLGIKARKHIKPGGEQDGLGRFRALVKKDKEEKRRQGRLLTVSEIKERLAAQNRLAGYWVPVLALAAAGMIAGGAYLGKDMRAFLESARGTQGEVIRVQSVYNSSSEGSSYTYYPVVAFRTETGESFEFRDNVGSNPPSYDTGDRVEVLYDPADPYHAIIDRGLWNWLAPVALLAGGLLLMWWSLKTAASVRSRRGRV